MTEIFGWAALLAWILVVAGVPAALFFDRSLDDRGVDQRPNPEPQPDVADCDHYGVADHCMRCGVALPEFRANQ